MDFLITKKKNLQRFMVLPRYLKVVQLASHQIMILGRYPCLKFFNFSLRTWQENLTLNNFTFLVFRYYPKLLNTT